jgi:hypothetical protein
MSEDTRRFRSISDREAQIIWAMCKQSPSGKWSGITRAIREIQSVRGGKSVSRTTVYDFLKAHPKPDGYSDYIGGKYSKRSKSPDEIIESAMIQIDTEDRGGGLKTRVSNMLYAILHRLWKDHALLLDAGGRYYSREKRVHYWISWANPPLFSEEYGWRGPTIFPDLERADERSIRFTRVVQDRERVTVSFEMEWENP